MTAPAPVSIITVAEAKEQLNIPASDTSYDTEIAGYTSAATGLIEDYRQEVLAQREVTEYVRTRWTTSIVLSAVPLVEIRSVARTDGLVVWDVANLRIEDPQVGRIVVASGEAFSGSLKVVILAGYSTVPENIRLATKLVVAHLWESQQRPSVGPQPIGGAPSPEFMTPVGAGLPPMAVALLGGHPPVIA